MSSKISKTIKTPKKDIQDINSLVIQWFAWSVYPSRTSKTSWQLRQKNDTWELSLGLSRYSCTTSKTFKTRKTKTT